MKTKILWTSLGLVLFAFFARWAWFIPETDYLAYYTAGQRALNARNLYESDLSPFKYLPVTSFFFAPFSLLPFQISKFAFFLLSFGCGIAVYARIRRHLGDWSALIVLFSVVRFHNYDFLNSQVNHLLLFLLVLYLEFRKSHTVLAALCFSIFSSFKVLPLLILAPLLLMKKFRECAAILGCFLVLSLLPALWFKDGFSIYRLWFNLMRETTPFPAPTDSILQSLQAMLWYWVGPLFGSAFQFAAMSYTLQLGLLGAVCYLALKAKTTLQEQLLVNASIVLSILISPLAWKHNYLLVAPTIALLLAQKAYPSLVWSAVLMTGVPTLISPFSHHWANRSYTTPLGACVLFFTCLVLASKNPPAQQLDI